MQELPEVRQRQPAPGHKVLDELRPAEASTTLVHLSGMCVKAQDEVTGEDSTVLVFSDCADEPAKNLHFREAKGGAYLFQLGRQCAHPDDSLEASSEPRLSFPADCSSNRHILSFQKLAEDEQLPGFLIQFLGGAVQYCIHPYQGSESPSDGTELINHVQCDRGRKALRFRVGDPEQLAKEEPQLKKALGNPLIPVPQEEPCSYFGEGKSQSSRPGRPCIPPPPFWPYTGPRVDNDSEEDAEPPARRRRIIDCDEQRAAEELLQELPPAPKRARFNSPLAGPPRPGAAAADIDKKEAAADPEKLAMALPEAAAHTDEKETAADPEKLALALPEAAAHTDEKEAAADPEKLALALPEGAQSIWYDPVPKPAVSAQERDIWGELVTQKFGLPLHLYDCYIPLDRSPPMSGTAPNNSQKCLKNDLGEPKLDVICYAANYYPHRSCLAGQDIVVESRHFVTLEEQLRGWPKLSVHLKIDVEGSEWDVLEWLTNNPAEWDKVRTLDMEIHFGFGSAAELPQYKAWSLQEKLTRQVSIMEALRKRFFCTGSTLEVYRQGWSPQDNCGVQPCGEPPVYLPNGFSVTAFAVSYVHKELVDVRLD